jgi:hypothetical protein
MADQETKLPFGLELIMNEIMRLNSEKRWGSIKIITMFSQKPFVELATYLQTREMSFDYRDVFHNEDIALFGCTAYRKVKGLELSGSFYAIEKRPYLYFITGEKNVFVSKVLLRISAHLYSKGVMRTYVTSDDLFTLLKNFSENKGIDLRYTEFVSKRMFGKAFTDLRHDKRLDSRKYEPYSEAFRKATEQGGRIDRIRVLGDNFSFSLSRSGLLKIYLGDFEDYYYHFITQIAQIAVNRWKIFEKRSRGEQPQREVKPILVNFDSNVFEETNDRKQFIQVLSEYPHCEYSVIHDGNPHVYVAILDKIDNSSFTVRTYDANSLLLVPQIRTTQSSLVRFSKHLLDKFQEGDLVEFQKRGA